MAARKGACKKWSKGRKRCLKRKKPIAKSAKRKSTAKCRWGKLKKATKTGRICKKRPGGRKRR